MEFNDYSRELVASLFEAGFNKLEISRQSKEEIQVKTSAGLFTVTAFSLKNENGVTLRVNDFKFVLIYEDEFYNVRNFRAGVNYAAQLSVKREFTDNNR